jgi:cell division protein FtsI (penicillin-binding protein 3)
MSPADPPLAAVLSGAARPVGAPPRRASRGGAGAEWRLALVACGFALMFGAVAVRMAALAASEPGEPRVTASDAVDHAARAPIVDRKGRPLAMNLPAWSVYAQPAEIDDPDRAARRLAATLSGVDEASLRARLERRRGFTWIKRPITPEERQAVHDLGIPGIYFGSRDARVYPGGAIAAHVLGGTRAASEGVSFADTVGLAGVERYYDETLRDPARNGEPLRLTLDLSAQAALTEVLRGAVERFGAKGAAGVLMEARTGKVTALVSLPDFDPNARPDPNAPDVRAARPLRNRVAEGVYELGSTFKPIFAAMALDAGLVTPDTLLDAKGPLVWGRRRITDFHRMPPLMSLTEAIVESSNVAMGRLAIMAGTPRAQEFLKKLGFFEATRLEIAEASLGAPLLPPRWSELSTITISYGHGLAATPLHLAAAYASLTNGGLRVQPTLDPDAAQPTEADRVVSARTSAQVRAMLRGVVARGTGKLAEAPGYEVGGKTGTADKPKPGGGYEDKKVLSTFAAVFPASDPAYVLVLTLDEPVDRSGPVLRRTAGWTAAPVTGEAIARLAPLLGLRPHFDPPAAPTSAVAVVASN